MSMLPQEETGASPLITPFGVHCLEKLGDTLLKNGETRAFVSASHHMLTVSGFVPGGVVAAARSGYNAV